ncbi:amidohydrolase [Roseomonas hellenica]|nr:amidohydrolase [Plastoroseomonas hellenica]MBR0644658.1 amidohydrolase [Plastoroseomonas hellenica]
MDPALAERLTAWRRHLHTHPELSQQEAATSRFVQQRLVELGVPFVAGVGAHGIVATLSRGGSNRSVGLRADMDALPIAETTGLAYASANPGVMHACGHDGHTVSLLGAAALLQADPDWRGTVQLIFQPAEEDGTGARGMIADGLFERFPMERVFAFHNLPGLETGTVGVRPGPVMAQGGRIVITVAGHAGHGAKPHLTRDPIVAAAQLITALQSVVARNVDPLEPAVVTIGAIHGGTVSNQIPETVTLHGTVRSFRPGQRPEIIADIQRICDGIGVTFGVTVALDAAPGGMVTINSEEGAALAAGAAEQAGFPVRCDIPPSTGGEDFAFMLAQRPGAMAWIGNGPAEPGRELHNPGYDFNDAILPVAATWLAGVAKRALVEGEAVAR